MTIIEKIESMPPEYAYEFWEREAIMVESGATQAQVEFEWLRMLQCGRYDNLSN